MLDNFSTVLETHPIDWCYNCAYSYLRDINASTEQKLFCLAFVQYARLIVDKITKATTYEFISDNELVITFDEKIFSEWDIEAVEKVRHRANYYKFLFPLIREHVMSYAKVIIDIKSCKAKFDKEGNLTVTCKLQ